MFDDDEMIGYSGEMVKVADLTVDELNSVLDEYEHRVKQGAATGHESGYLTEMMAELRATIAYRRAQGGGRHVRMVRMHGTYVPGFCDQSDDPEHLLGYPKLGRPLAPGLASGDLYVFHLHPLKGWVREYQRTGSTYYFDAESKVLG